MSSPEFRDYRYERKFLVERLDAKRVRALVRLHPAMFYEPYPPRHVNNLYLDTEDMRNYFDNVSGAGERRKARIRWYGDLFRRVDRPALEFKIKSGLVGAKAVYPFAPFTLDDAFGHRAYLDAARAADLPGGVEQVLRGMSVVLCNRYYRWYYATRDGRFRVTVDTEMAYYQARRLGSPFMRRHEDHTHVIVELKYDRPLDVQAERVSGYFPFSVSKNSKYVTGIETVGWG